MEFHLQAIGTSLHKFVFTSYTVLIQRLSSSLFNNTISRTFIILSIIFLLQILTTLLPFKLKVTALDETKQYQLIRLKLTAAHILFSFWFIKFMQVRITKIKSKIYTYRSSLKFYLILSSPEDYK